MQTRRRGNDSQVALTDQHEQDRGITPELIGIVLAVLILAAVAGIVITIGA